MDWRFFQLLFQDDVRPCMNNPCQNGAACLVTVGGVNGNFICQCQEGWAGQLCDIDVGPCSGFVEPCLNGGICFTLGGGNFGCQCVDGYSGNRWEMYIIINRFKTKGSSQKADGKMKPSKKKILSPTAPKIWNCLIDFIRSSDTMLISRLKPHLLQKYLSWQKQSFYCNTYWPWKK